MHCKTFKKLFQKLQQEFNRSKSSKVEAKLQDAKKTTGSIRKQLDSLTAGSFDVSIKQGYMSTLATPLVASPDFLSMYITCHQWSFSFFRH